MDNVSKPAVSHETSNSVSTAADIVFVWGLLIGISCIIGAGISAAIQKNADFIPIYVSLVLSGAFSISMGVALRNIIDGLAKLVTVAEYEHDNLRRKIN